MIEETELDDTQTEIIQEETEVEEVPLTPEQIADLQRAAEVSSQNYERAKKAEKEKKELQERIAQYEAQLETDVDPDNVIIQKVNELAQKLNQIETEKQLDSVQAKYPSLKEKEEDFIVFLQQYPGVALESVAKLFLSENGMLETTPKRKGLVEARGGQRVAPSTGKLSAADVKRLRETNYPEYMKLIKSGKLQIDK